MSLATNVLGEKQFWLAVEYVGVPFLPTLALIFSLQYAGMESWLSRKFVVLVVGFSALTTVVEWTNEFHHLYYSSVAVDDLGSFSVVSTVKGIWFWLFMAYANIAALLAVALLFRSYLKGKGAYRKQSFIILIGALIPWFSLLIYLLGESPYGLDITPLGFVATGTIYLWGTFRYRILDLIPIASESIWENMRDGLILVDDSNCLLNFNESARKILSAFATPIRGMNVCADFYGFSEYMLERKGTGGDECVFELKCNDKAKYFRVNISPVMDPKNRELGNVVVLTDITERKKMEEEISESEKKYRELVENALIGIYKFDLDGIILYANKAMASMLEYDSPQELISLNFSAVWNTPQHLDAFVNNLVQFGVTGESIEVKLKTKRGNFKHVLLSASIQGDVISGMAKDITELRTLEKYSFQTQNLEALGNIALGVAHDFNNLLGVILGYSTLLGRSGFDEAKMERATKAITRSVERGKLLVKQLLMFAQRSSGVFTLVQINDIVIELGKMIAKTFPDSIEISLQLMSGLPLVSADIAQINQVLLNICYNARDAMEKGGRLSILTAPVFGETLRKKYPDASAEGYVEIRITDTGIGMDKMMLDRIFEPFFTTKGVGKGTGLGLSVAYGIVSTHKGYIDVASEPSCGTTFAIYLPVAEPRPDFA